MHFRFPEISYQKQMLFVLLLMPAVLCAQDYLWPTNASTYMSSSFCEFRNGHYHSAIDIKTWLREGYNCFAIDDGEIMRIRVSPFGYGKVLYLRLKDGNTAVYAHLQGFPLNIEKQIRRKQLENKRYSIDWSPKDLKVKKGDIIAYTGRTGTGLPHLHFEIRNTKGHPVNPLAYYDQIKDTIRPSLEQLAVIPLDPGTTVNNSYTPQIFDLLPVSSGKYQIKGRIRIHGRAGLALRGVDRANDISNKYGFYRTRLEIDRRPVFQITYDELDFATTEHIFRALQAGARGYLLKESAGAEVVEAVRAVNIGRRHLSQKISDKVVNGFVGQDEAKRDQAPLARLSPREREILQLVVEGKSSAEIGHTLALSPKTVETYRSRLMKKLGLSNLPDLVKFAVRHGLTPLE